MPLERTGLTLDDERVAAVSGDAGRIHMDIATMSYRYECDMIFLQRVPDLQELGN